MGRQLKRQKREFFDGDKTANFYRKYQEKNTDQQIETYDNIDASKLEMSFDDTLYSKQWYLVRYFIIISIKKNDMFRKIKVS